MAYPQVGQKRRCTEGTACSRHESRARLLELIQSRREMSEAELNNCVALELRDYQIFVFFFAMIYERKLHQVGPVHVTCTKLYYCVKFISHVHDFDLPCQPVQCCPPEPLPLPLPSP